MSIVLCKAVEVFVPYEVPTVTYVYRQEHDLESQLRNALTTPGLIVSLSGPSKSGKTVLINKIIPKDNLIQVSGGAIKSPEMLWERILNWMDAPSEVTRKSSRMLSGDLTGKATGRAGIPFLAEGSVEGAVKGGIATTTEAGVRSTRQGLDQVVREIANSEFVVFIDDFHYMPREVQKDVAKQIKEAAEKGVRISTASVPHRADDVVRSNPELRGRVQAVDFEYWSGAETLEIAKQGFPALGINLDLEVISRLSDNVFGSPQLMQSVCLQVCRDLGIEATKVPAVTPTVDDLFIRRVMQHTSTLTDFSSLLDALHSGPKPRGTERNRHDFTDGSNGDVYRCVLLALRSDPPLLSLPYDEIYKRTREVCVDPRTAPGGSRRL
jgi:hypothetical protein